MPISSQFIIQPIKGFTVSTSVSTPVSTTEANRRIQPRRHRRRRDTPREEVTMMKRLRSILRLGWQPALKDKTLFDGQLLDQKREDVYVVMHQMGVIR